MIEIKNLCKSFGDLQVIKDISVTINDGDKVVIIGPSGNSLRASCNDLFPFPKAVRATGRYVLRRAQHFSAIFCGVQGGKALNAQQQRFLQQKRSGRGGGAAYGSKAVYDSGAANGSKAVCGDFFTTAVFPCTEGLLDSTKRARPQARSF